MTIHSYSPHDAMLPTTTSALEEEISKLKVCYTTPSHAQKYTEIYWKMQETVEAFKQQNVFLSREILELHQLRTADVETMSKLKR